MADKHFVIGKVYRFDYQSSSKSKYEKIYAVMSDELKKEIVDYLIENAIKCLERYDKQYAKSQEIVGAKDKELQKQLKAEYYEAFKSKGEKTDKTKARELFIRQYNPDNMDIKDDGSIEAVFAGFTATVTGKTTYKWYVFSECGINKKYYAEEYSPFVNVIK